MKSPYTPAQLIRLYETGEVPVLPQAASELPASETAGPAKVVAAVATCSGAVSSAGVLEIARLLEMQACDKDQSPADAGLLMYCTEVLRQHAGAMTERQPLPNH